MSGSIPETTTSSIARDPTDAIQSRLFSSAETPEQKKMALRRFLRKAFREGRTSGHLSLHSIAWECIKTCRADLLTLVLEVTNQFNNIPGTRADESLLKSLIIDLATYNPSLSPSSGDHARHLFFFLTVLQNYWQTNYEPLKQKTLDQIDLLGDSLDTETKKQILAALEKNQLPMNEILLAMQGHEVQSLVSQVMRSGSTCLTRDGNPVGAIHHMFTTAFTEKRWADLILFLKGCNSLEFIAALNTLITKLDFNLDTRQEGPSYLAFRYLLSEKNLALTASTTTAESSSSAAPALPLDRTLFNQNIELIRLIVEKDLILLLGELINQFETRLTALGAGHGDFRKLTYALAPENGLNVTALQYIQALVSNLSSMTDNKERHKVLKAYFQKTFEITDPQLLSAENLKYLLSALADFYRYGMPLEREDFIDTRPGAENLAHLDPASFETYFQNKFKSAEAFHQLRESIDSLLYLRPFASHADASYLRKLQQDFKSQWRQEPKLSPEFIEACRLHYQKIDTSDPCYDERFPLQVQQLVTWGRMDWKKYLLQAAALLDYSPELAYAKVSFGLKLAAPIFDSRIINQWIQAKEFELLTIIFRQKPELVTKSYLNQIFNSLVFNDRKESSAFVLFAEVAVMNPALWGSCKFLNSPASFGFSLIKQKVATFIKMTEKLSVPVSFEALKSIYLSTIDPFRTSDAPSKTAGLLEWLDEIIDALRDSNSSHNSLLARLLVDYINEGGYDDLDPFLPKSALRQIFQIVQICCQHRQVKPDPDSSVAAAIALGLEALVFSDNHQDLLLNMTLRFRNSITFPSGLGITQSTFYPITSTGTGDPIIQPTSLPTRRISKLLKNHFLNAASAKEKIIGPYSEVRFNRLNAYLLDRSRSDSCSHFVLPYLLSSHLLMGKGKSFTEINPTDLLDMINQKIKGSGFPALANAEQSCRTLNVLSALAKTEQQQKVVTDSLSTVSTQLSENKASVLLVPFFSQLKKFSEFKTLLKDLLSYQKKWTLRSAVVGEIFNQFKSTMNQGLFQDTVIQIIHRLPPTPISWALKIHLDRPPESSRANADHFKVLKLVNHLQREDLATILEGSLTKTGATHGDSKKLLEDIKRLSGDRPKLVARLTEELLAIPGDPTLQRYKLFESIFREVLCLDTEINPDNPLPKLFTTSLSLNHMQLLMTAACQVIAPESTSPAQPIMPFSEQDERMRVDPIPKPPEPHGGAGAGAGIYSAAIYGGMWL